MAENTCWNWGGYNYITLFTAGFWKSLPFCRVNHFDIHPFFPPTKTTTTTNNWGIKFGQKSRSTLKIWIPAVGPCRDFVRNSFWWNGKPSNRLGEATTPPMLCQRFFFFLDGSNPDPWWIFLGIPWLVFRLNVFFFKVPFRKNRVGNWCHLIFVQKNPKKKF